MRRIIDFLIDEKMAISLFVVAILIGGFYTLTSINREAFPEVALDVVTIQTIYPGASSDDVENMVTIPIEKKLREISGIDKVVDHSLENCSFFVVYLEDNLTKSKRAKVIDDIKNAVKGISDFPSNVKMPEVTEITTEKTEAIDIALTTDKKGDEGYGELYRTAKSLRDKLLFVDGVAEVQKLGYFDREYLIEVDPAALRNYRIGLNMVLYRLQSRNIDLPGGVLRVGDNEFVLRTTGQYKDIEDIRNTVIFSNDAGFVTRLTDIAKVTDTFKEADILHRVNGQDAIIFQVNKKQSADMIKTVNRIKDLMKTEEKELPSGVSAFCFNDYSRFVQSRLSALIINSSIGFALLLVILLVLLGYRMSAIVSTSIPVTFMIAFMCMKALGITLNIVSMFALLMVLGMVVDFSVVVCENTYRYMEKGFSRREAVEKGLSEVLPAMTTTLICIVVAFAPLLFVTGLIGKFVFAIPAVIIICLVASFLCAVLVMPMMLDSFARVNQSKAAGFGQKTSQGIYRRILMKIVQHRYRAVLTLIVVSIVVMIAATQYSGFVFVKGAADAINVKTSMPRSTSLEANKKAIIPLEQVVKDLYPAAIVESVHSYIGAQTRGKADFDIKDGIYKGTIQLNLSPEEGRAIKGEDILKTVREKISAAQKSGAIDPRLEITYEIGRLGLPVGSAINVEIRGDDFSVLSKIADEYKAYLGSMHGVEDVYSDLEPGKEEYHYMINEEKAGKAGLSAQDISQALYVSFKGAVATTVTKGDEKIDLLVRFPDWARRRTDSLNDVMVSNAYGSVIPLSEVTSYRKQVGISMINRKNYMRLVQVKANVDGRHITSLAANTLLNKHFKDIEKRYPGYTVNYGGEQEDTEKSLKSLGVLFIIAIIAIYMIIAAFFNSLSLPIVVMICIPFSMVGIYLALFAHGNLPLTFMGLLGAFSLASIIVSNTLVLVQFINNARNKGMSVTEAVVEGSTVRLRPIFLTSGVVVLGLIPTIYGFGGKDDFVVPLAMAFGYGLLFTTILTLVIVPCFYHILIDIKQFLGISTDDRSSEIKRERIKNERTRSL